MPVQSFTTARHVLMIDDDPDDFELLCEALTEIDANIVCHTASDGQIGLDILISHKNATPELIFVDLNMPRMNGLKFLEKIKLLREFKDIPVTIYSTSVPSGGEALLIAAGAAYVITKPIDYQTLKTSLIPIVTKASVTF